MVNSEGRKVKVEKIDQIGIVVEDREKAIETWERMVGIGPWTVRTNKRTDAEGNAVEVKVAFAYVGDLEIELIEVSKGKTIHSEWLKEHGEGLHHLSFCVDDPDEEAAKMVEQGAEIMFQKPGQFTYLDCGPGGVIFETQRRHEKVTGG